MATLSQIPTKKELMSVFGHLAFSCALIDIDVIGIQLKKSGETVVITYRGIVKTGYIYEGGKLTPQDVFQIFCDVPNNWNDLGKYMRDFEELVEVLNLRKDMYVWINEQEIQEVKIKK